MEHIRNAIRADQELLIQKQIQLLHAKNNQELRDQIEAEVEDIQEEEKTSSTTSSPISSMSQL